MKHIVILLVAAAGLVACGDDDDSTDATTEAVAASTASTAPAATTGAPDSAAPTTEGAPTTAAPESTPATSAPAEGVMFTSPEGDFSVLLPSAPEETTQDVPMPDGTTAPLTAWQALLGDEGAYTVARLSFPAGIVLDPAAALQGAQDQALSLSGATLTGSQDIDLAGVPGREFTATVSQSGVEGTLIQRVYLAGNTLYQINFVGEGPRAITDAEVAPFFESFTITAE